MFCHKNSNQQPSKGFCEEINILIISANELKIEVLSSTNPRMKLCQISIRLVWECWTRFLEMLMALVLAQYMVRCF